MCRTLRGSLLLVLGLALPVACNLSPDTPIYVSGVALDARGQPLSLATLEVSRLGLLDGGVLNGLLPPFRWLPDGTQPTQIDGRFSFGLTLEQADIPGNSFKLQLPGVGTAAGASYWISPAPIDLPPARAWELAPTVESVLGVTTVAVAPVPQCRGNAETFIQGSPFFVNTYRYELFLGDQLAWSVWTSDPQVQLTDSLFEEVTQARLHVSHFQSSYQFAHRLTDVNQSAVQFGTEYESDLTLTRAAGGVPVSRGASCSGLGVPLSPCPFTDGDLTVVSIPAPTDDAGILTFNLPRPAQLRELVFRGAQQSALFHVDASSDDGGTWNPVVGQAMLAGDAPAELSSSDFLREEDNFAQLGYVFMDMQVSLPAPVTKVRLVFDFSYGTLSFSEISMFE